MGNFDKKVKYLNSLFINKFKVYDHENQKLKIYFISPDKSHMYMSIDNVIGVDKSYLCEIGKLYFDKTKMLVFEDTPTECFRIDKSEHKYYKRYYDDQPFWGNHKISDIIDSYNGKRGFGFSKTNT